VAPREALTIHDASRARGPYRAVLESARAEERDEAQAVCERTDEGARGRRHVGERRTGEERHEGRHLVRRAPEEGFDEGAGRSTSIPAGCARVVTRASCGGARGSISGHGTSGRSGRPGEDATRRPLALPFTYSRVRFAAPPAEARPTGLREKRLGRESPRACSGAPWAGELRLGRQRWATDSFVSRVRRTGPREVRPRRSARRRARVSLPARGASARGARRRAPASAREWRWGRR
jgi:hypothetical protein